MSNATALALWPTSRTLAVLSAACRAHVRQPAKETDIAAGTGDKTEHRSTIAIAVGLQVIMNRYPRLLEAIDL